MQLVKFSETQHHIDQNGTLSIIIDKEIILKLSPVDSFISCLEQLRQLLPIDKIGIVEDIVTKIMTTMDIPQEILERVSSGFQHSKKDEDHLLTTDHNDDSIRISQSKKIVTETESVINETEKDWLLFVSKLVNDKHPVCIFDIEEINEILDGECMEKFVNFLEKRYSLKIYKNSIEISIKRG